MAWLGKVSLGGFPDLAGAVTKISESVKNIEKNFDTALGLEENPSGGGEDSGIWPLASDENALFDPEMSVMGQGKASDEVDQSGKVGLQEDTSLTVREAPSPASAAVTPVLPQKNEASDRNVEDSISHESEAMLSVKAAERHEDRLYSEDVSIAMNSESIDSNTSSQQNEEPDSELAHESPSEESTTRNYDVTKQMESDFSPLAVEVHHVSDSQQSQEKQEIDVVNVVDEATSKLELTSNTSESTSGDIPNDHSSHAFSEHQLPDSPRPNEASARLSESNIENNEVDSDVRPAEVNHEIMLTESDSKEQSIDSRTYTPSTIDPCMELEKVNKEMKIMEAALQGAAKQSQVKADEIAKLMNENEFLKSTIEDLKKKSVEAENDALREEYHQRVSSLERKVYALTRERDTLRREQNKKNDVTALLKEKDEIISQVMAEGETLSKKQATQEATIRKLRAQIREFEEDKQRLNSKLQVEETKVESIKRDKAATEKLLQETIERNQAELASQKEFYSNALNAAKEAETLAEARANNEAKAELENRLREAAEREAMLVQTLEELRQTLSRTERQAAFREDMLQRDIDDLQKRYQASELRYNELIAQVPESTRPLLRQIEAMQEAAARKAEAWAGVEANLNSRLEAAEAKAAASEEKEHLMNDRLSQTLSRMTVLETQIACLRTEQTQVSRSLDKERQRASENRQEYLAAMEEVATHEGRSKQLEEELRELRTKHRQELQEVLVQKELLEKDLERERSSRLELESSHLESSADQDPILKHTRAYAENGKFPVKNLLSAGSLGNMEENHFLQTLDSSEGAFTDRRNSVEMSHYYLKSMTPSAFESALRQKDGELASYISRLASLESLRDSLAEELVKMTAQSEKLQAEASLIPGIRAELEALRRRHSSALELMGERDEELEELRADIVDMKEMYREQVDLLVNKIQTMTSVDAV